ncbi:MAG: HEAT repeat domain-containing protein [Planctomycetota bacterium]
MTDKPGVLTLAVYVSVTAVIVVAAFLGVLYYGVMPRISALAKSEGEWEPEAGPAQLRVSSDVRASRADRGPWDRQRVRLLESMLAEKSELVRDQARRIDRQAAALEELQQSYDEAVQLVIDAVEVQPGAETDEGEMTSSADDPRQLESELMLTRTVYDTLVGDLDVLRRELDSAYQEVDALNEELSAGARYHKDALAVEGASASVLLRIGEDAVPALIEALADANPVVRRWAATMLGGMGPGTDGAIGALTEALSDADPQVRAAAQRALDAIERL